MKPATKMWIEALLRLAKGMIAETEKWLKAQDQI
jgi:hypothetical protein